MTRITGPDCVVMVQFNKYTHTHAYTHTHTHTDWVLKGEVGVMTTQLLEYVAPFDDGGDVG